MLGQAGIYSPIDIGYNADGIVQQGTLNQNALITATIALEKLEHTRMRTSHSRTLSTTIELFD